jgi:site-specific DNA-cytosine methylase
MGNVFLPSLFRKGDGVKRWQTLIAIDNDPAAAATYAVNFPGVRVECAPVSNLLDQLPDADVIIGGPPCQPFSTAGDGDGSNDKRDCIPDFVEAVLKVRPKQFLMENVPGLLAEKHIGHLSSAVQRLEREGYEIQTCELDAVSFGVPQFRNRVWVWGIRADLKLKHQWPKPTHAWPPPEKCMFGGELKAGVTVRQALELEGAIRKPRSKKVIRRDHPTDEPSPTVEARASLGGGSVLCLVSGSKCRKDANGVPRGPLVRSVDAPSFTIDSTPPGTRIEGAKGYSGQRIISGAEPSPTITGEGTNPEFIRIMGGGHNHPADENGYYRRDKRDITDEPSTTISGYNGSTTPFMVAIDKTLDKPCPTISAGSHSGGPEPVNNRVREGFIRRLQPLECARLQSVPDDFKWPAKITKTAMYRIVGNGWASKMGKVFAAAFHAVDPKSRTVIDLFCGGGLGASGWHGRAWEYLLPSPTKELQP